MPDTPKLAAQCQLDRDRLKRIEDKLEETHSDVKQILAYDGPLGTLNGTTLSMIWYRLTTPHNSCILSGGGK